MSTTGIDVSHYQGSVDWFTVRAAGAAFAFAKATEGLSVTDPQFSTNWQGIKDSGLYRGAYHFGHPGSDPDAQALHFHSVVGELAWGDLPPVLDIETSDGHPADAVIAWVLRFVARAESLFARPVILYTGGFWRNALGNPLVPALAKQPLWIANYRGGAPVLPRNWSGWAFWQYSDGNFGQPGPMPGVRGPCDRDRFVGDLTQLESLSTLAATGGAGSGTVPTPTPTPNAATPPWPGSYFIWPNKQTSPVEAVQLWQQRMQTLGYPLRSDGFYGPSSKATCMSFQRDQGLSVDGIVGPLTWRATFGQVS